MLSLSRLRYACIKTEVLGYRPHVVSNFTCPTMRRFSSNFEKARSVFDDYRSAVKRLELYAVEEEKRKSERMYQAWAKTQDKTPASQSVVVVRTLAQETKSKRLRDASIKSELESKATILLKKAATEFHHPEALVLWGNLLLENVADTDIAQQKDFIEQAIDSYRRSKTARGWFNLGLLFWNGYPDQSEQVLDPAVILLPASEEKAMEAFSMARDLNDADALYFCGVNAINSPDGVETDESDSSEIHQGLAWIQQSSDQGHGAALYYLALLHLSGNPSLSVDVDIETFWQYLLKAAGAGNADAVFFMGHLYLKGEHGAQADCKAALTCFERAATELNHGEAAVSAGAMYFNGTGVPENKERAFELYQLGGELGCLEGWRNVVSCYASGEGVSRNDSIARYIADTMLA